MSTIARLTYVRIVVAAAYLCGILFSHRLWFGAGRTFPRVPLLESLPAFILAHDYLLSILLVVALVLSIFSKRPARFLVAIATLTTLLVVCDVTRLQPWVYQYVLMLLLLACRHLRIADATLGRSVLAANQLLIVALYFWSGLQKLNWSFAHEVLPNLLTSAGFQHFQPGAAYVSAAGAAVALCEASIGVGLFFWRTRKAAVLIASSLHLVVLLLLILAGSNSVVWPWNVAMLVMIWLLFWREEGSLTNRTLWQWRSGEVTSHLVATVLIVCGLAPALSFAGWWDMYLSASLYSGNTPVAVIQVDENLRSRLPVMAQRQLLTTSRRELMLPLHDWAMAELNVPPYPEDRVYRQLASQLCSYDHQPHDLLLIVKERPSLLDGSYSVSRTNCRDLLSR